MSVSETEKAVVDLIAEGYARWAIAVKLGLSEERVRDVIRALCGRFDCPMIELPDMLGVPMLGDDDDGIIRVDDLPGTV